MVKSKELAADYCNTARMALALSKHSSYSCSAWAKEVMALPTENDT
jgi:hypothetical protein